jgi:hypothetical protein
VTSQYSQYNTSVRIQLTLECFTTGLVRERLLLAVVWYVTNKVADQTLIVTIGKDVEVAVILSQLLTLSFSEHGAFVTDLEWRIVNLASGWVTIEDRGILGHLLTKTCRGSTRASNLRRRTGSD